MLLISVLSCLLVTALAGDANVITGSQCSKNQVVRKLTVYEDGALEAECGPVPCGEVGRRCIDDQTQCRAETDVFSGMRWAPNGESILLRCCTMQAKNKIYVGTDVVSAGSFYEGGEVAAKDLYGDKGGAEYDFVANARTEQGGVRVWVYRMICAKGEKPVNFEPITTTSAPKIIKTTAAPVPTTPVVEEEEEETVQTEGEEQTNDNEAEVVESNDEEEEVEEEEEEEEVTTTPEPKVFNPLRYRPPHFPRQSTGVRRA
ncbi:CBN-WRT-10 protein [Caenorhabditis brenneri]|uniref:CBN-WRT-10 protein n=1 Tax=Caenorhabditis brenneri TaxID=135651 RepID=G0N9I1_CAEBE|nr:CBN-WRT-10 protein [Caenorhabditis brenneri]